MFDRHGTGVPVVRRKMPDVATLLLLMEDGKLAKLRWCRRFTFLRQQGRTCDKDPPAYADPLHLQVSVGVKAFAKPSARRSTLTYLDSCRTSASDPMSSDGTDIHSSRGRGQYRDSEFIG